MWTALFRKARSDTLSQPLQTVLVFIVVAAATATFTFALSMGNSVGDAFLDRHADTNGSHVWFISPEGRSESSFLAPIADMEGVTASSGPFPVLFGKSTLLTDDLVVDLRVFGLPSDQPELSKPIITSGRWLAAGGNREVVLDKGLGRELGLGVGESVEVLTNGNIESFSIVGFAVMSDMFLYPWDNDSGFALVLPETIEFLEPDPSKRAWRLSVQIASPENALQFGNDAIARYQGPAPDWESWLHLEEDLTETFKLFATIFGLFGVIAVAVAAFVIVNVVGGYVMARARDIGLLKSIGYTPRQVAALLLIEHVGLSLPAAALGIVIGFAVAPVILSIGETALGTSTPASLDPLLTTAIFLGVPLTIAVITLLPAWRGGHVSTVQALTVGLAGEHSKPSRAGRLASQLRTGAVISLGLKDIFNRPFRAALTVLALMVGVILATFTLGMDATLKDIIDDPRLTGDVVYEATVRRGHDLSVSDIEARDLIAARSGVEAVRPQKRLLVVFKDSQYFGGVAVEGDPASLVPHLTSGRVFTGPGEAIISRELADFAGAGLGDEITVEVARDAQLKGKKFNLRVVGIYIRGDFETIFDLDTIPLQTQVSIEPDSYAVKLVDTVDPEGFKAALVRETSGRLRIEVDDFSANNREAAGFIRPPLYGVTGAILAIGAINLLISLFFGVRERFRDFGIMKTLGFTPGQILASVSISAVFFAIVAIAIGTPLGLLFTRFILNFIGEEAGAGSPFGSMPGPGGMAVLALITLSVALIGALVPARRAAAVSVTDALRYE